MQFHCHRLANGLTVIGETIPTSRSAAMGFFVRTGSRDEMPEEAGVSHFLEHMAFKGNERRTALEVNRDFDRIGAEPNAYTSEENTVYYAAVLTEYMPQALDILANLLRPSLRQEDFELEKQVIINEIGRYLDMPSSCASDHAQKAFFHDHCLGNSVLGTKESITALTRDQMAAYHRRRYVASNITLAVAGGYDWDRLIELVERQCGDWPTGEAPRVGLREAVGSGRFEIVTKEKVEQEYALLLSAGPPASSPLRHAADLLGMAIGDDSGSRLYWELVDPGLAESASCSFHEYMDTGVFYTNVFCDPENAEQDISLACKVLHQVQCEGIRQEELEQARNKLLSHLVRSGERTSRRMFSIGSAWTYYGTYRSIDDEVRAYEKVTLDDIRAVLDRYPLDRVTTVALGPLSDLKTPQWG